MNHPILLFDGECNFCRACIRWLVEHDPPGRLHYATLQSGAGRQLLASHGVDPDAVESVMLIDRGRAYRKSEAVLQAMEWIQGPWRHARVLRRIPRVLRDFVYNRVSHNRPLISRMIGTAHRRYEPQGEARQRFLSC